MRTDRGLTTRGRCLLAGGAAATVCALLLDERDLLRVGIAAILLPLTAWLVYRWRRVSLTPSHRVIPDRLRPGMTGSVRLTVTNSGSRRSGRLELTDPPTPGLSRGARGVVPSLAPGAAAAIDYPLAATRRGRFVLGPPTAQLGDPFGLWEARQPLHARAEVIVVPPVWRLSGTPSAAGSRSAAAGTASSGQATGDPDVGIRSYHPGDDIRTIHWRASARRDQLMVRLREPVTHTGATVILDHRAIAHPGVAGDGEGDALSRGGVGRADANGDGTRFGAADSSLETAVAMAASVCVHLLGRDFQLELRRHNGQSIAAGNDIADDILMSLADVEPDADPRIRADAFPATGLVVAILGDLDEATAKRLAASRSPAATAVAFVVDTASWLSGDGSTRAADAAGVLSAAGWRVSTLRRGDDLATAWQRVCPSPSRTTTHGWSAR